MPRAARSVSAGSPISGGRGANGFISSGSARPLGSFLRGLDRRGSGLRLETVGGHWLALKIGCDTISIMHARTRPFSWGGVTIPMVMTVRFSGEASPEDWVRFPATLGNPPRWADLGSFRRGMSDLDSEDLASVFSIPTSDFSASISLGNIDMRQIGFVSQGAAEASKPTARAFWSWRGASGFATLFDSADGAALTVERVGNE
jgi:hypothetical protein